jgi:acyl-coenzyme A thioesterase PaaI-like protein
MNTLNIWEKLSSKSGGKWAFSKALCIKAPYFASISPKFEELRPEFCQVRISKSRKVTNHLGTVHAIAMCNMAELSGGTMTEVTVPDTHRWIPKGMTVEYLKKATTGLVATATPATALDLTRPSEYKVNIEVKDEMNDIVFKAVITMWISEKKA